MKIPLKIKCLFCIYADKNRIIDGKFVKRACCYYSYAYPKVVTKCPKTTKNKDGNRE